MSVYGLILNYDCPEDFNPQMFEISGNEKHLKKYRKYTALHFEEVFEYIKRKNDEVRDVQILAVATCQQDENINELIECGHSWEYSRIDNCEKLHVHMLIYGKDCLEVIAWIKNYWEIHFGNLANVIRYNDQLSVNEWEQYFESRRLAKRNFSL